MDFKNIFLLVIFFCKNYIFSVMESNMYFIWIRRDYFEDSPKVRFATCLTLISTCFELFLFNALYPHAFFRRRSCIYCVATPDASSGAQGVWEAQFRFSYFNLTHSRGISSRRLIGVYTGRQKRKMQTDLIAPRRMQIIIGYNNLAWMLLIHWTMVKVVGQWLNVRGTLHITANRTRLCVIF
jgi:hypothetical protein